MTEPEKIIEVVSLSKSFLGVYALKKLSFDLYAGEIHCIVGENGAGKSTFIKTLSGALEPDEGDIIILRNHYRSLTPKQAQENRIQTVYQEDKLIPQITVAENLFLGLEDEHKIRYNHKKTKLAAQEFLDSLHIPVPVDAIYEKISLADQQYIKVARALLLDPKILILDEPTAVFNINDADKVLRFIKDIAKKGVGIIFITHHLEEVLGVADRITVFRDGNNVATHHTSEKKLTIKDLARDMVGRDVELFYKKHVSHLGKPTLRVENLQLKADSDRINFEVLSGEIFGIAGLVGAGRTEMARAIFGADPKIQGKVYLHDKEITPNNPAQAIKAGLGMITENRQIDGLCLSDVISPNITLPSLDKIMGWRIRHKQENRVAHNFVEKLKIKIASLKQEVQFLSGGNKQKVVLAKWLYRDSEVLIVDEPTNAVDINTKSDIYKLLAQLADEGKTIILISSDMPELITLCDRVMVMRNFSVSGELSGDRITEHNILEHFIS